MPRSSSIAIGLVVPVNTVADMSRLPAGLPSVPLTLETLRIILPYSVTMAAAGLMESLLTALGPYVERVPMPALVAVILLSGIFFAGKVRRMVSVERTAAPNGTHATYCITKKIFFA